MRAIRNILALAVICISLLSFLFISNVEAQEKEVITFWQLSVREDLMREILNKFEEENPEIRIEMQVLTWDYGLDKIVTAIAAKNAPDVFELGSTWTPQFNESGAICDLTQELSSYKNEYLFWEPVTYKDRLYGAPWLLGTRVFFYNKELFKEAGLDPNHPPKTWEELLTAAEKINNLSDETYGFGIYVGEEYAPWQEFLPFAWSAGARVLAEDNKTPVFDSPEMIETFKFYNELKKYSMLERQGQINTSFAEGRIGMQISGAWNFMLIPNTNPQLNYAVALVPAKDEKSLPVSFGGGEILVISKETKHFDASLKLIKFLIREENMMKIVKAQKNILPSSKASINLSYFKDNPNYKAYFEQMKIARGAPSNAKWISIQKEITKAIDKIILQDAPLEKTVNEIQASISKILGKGEKPASASDKALTFVLVIVVLVIIVSVMIVKKARGKNA